MSQIVDDFMRQYQMPPSLRALALIWIDVNFNILPISDFMKIYFYHALCLINADTEGSFTFKAHGANDDVIRKKSARWLVQFLLEQEPILAAGAVRAKMSFRTIKSSSQSNLQI